MSRFFSLIRVFLHTTQQEIEYSRHFCEIEVTVVEESSQYHEQGFPSGTSQGPCGRAERKLKDQAEVFHSFLMTPVLHPDP